MNHDTCPSIRWQVFVLGGDNHDTAYSAGNDERPLREEMKKVALMTRIQKHHLSSWLIILSFLFFALSPTAIAQAKPDDNSMQSVIGQQNDQASSQENNNGKIGQGQDKAKADNRQNDGNYNQGKNSQSGQGNANQGNNDKGNPSNNGADPNDQPGNNGPGNSKGNGNPDGNASSDKDKNRGNLKADNANQKGRGAAAKADSMVDAISRGTRDAAEVLKSIPAKIVPTAITAAENLGAALAEKLEAIADFIQGIFGTTSPAMVAESTRASEG